MRRGFDPDKVLASAWAPHKETGSRDARVTVRQRLQPLSTRPGTLLVAVGTRRSTTIGRKSSLRCAAGSTTRTPARPLLWPFLMCSSSTDASLQQRADESSSSDPLDVASMTSERRDALRVRLLAEHPHLVAELTS
jgi:hypothetical protein